MSATLLVLQHIECEPPAAFEEELLERGLELVRVELDEGEALPEERDDVAGIVVMGGPIGAYEDDQHPWLASEKRYLRDAVARDVPVWGVCLGAQLLAASLGARVYRGPEAEVGLLPVELTEAAADDPVFGDVPGCIPTLQWHGDTFDLPEGATLLARSHAYRNQAFRVGRSYGLQFHVEVTPELAAQWGEVPAYAESLEAILGPGALDRLVRDLAANAAFTLPLARRLFGRWLARVVRVPAHSIG
jgi:GMP synthase (glutamine-hydrolysing)